MTGAASEAPRDPLKQLLAFHGELRRALKVLAGLAARGPGDVDAHEVSQLTTLLRGPLTFHDIDEETLLIPLIMARLGSLDLDPGLERCRRDHQQLEELVEALLEHLDEIARGVPSHPVLLTTASTELNALLLPHLDLEEQVVFPFARRLLTDDDLEHMGRALDERARARGLTPGEHVAG